MIDSLHGTLLEKTPDFVVVECGGVGYAASIASTTVGALPAIGQTCRIYTEMRVSENDIALYGFATVEERAMFRKLTSVSGVGPKAGLAILSVLSPQRIVLAIAAEDYKAFTAASGVGAKIAQRITLELKDKMKDTVQEQTFAASGEMLQNAGDLSQATAALISLGYTAAQAAQALAHLDTTLPVQELIKRALQEIGKRR